MHTLNVILPIIQQAHLPPVFYFHVLTLGSRRYLGEMSVKKEKKTESVNRGWEEVWLE